jgi:hypothetical protein
VGAGVRMQVRRADVPRDDPRAEEGAGQEMTLG